jgi:uncharacterized protein YjiS (DUF1127 family)
MSPTPARPALQPRPVRLWRRPGIGLSALVLYLILWRRRARTRRQLRALPDHLLADVGLSATERRRESARPFWRG